MSFVELSATSNFTFLTGASHPEELMERAALIGLGGLVIADENSVAGIVRAHVQAREIARIVARAFPTYALPFQTTAGNSTSAPIPRLQATRNGGLRAMCVCACAREAVAP